MPAQKWLELPRLVRFMIFHFMNGALMGSVFGVVLIATDTAGLGRLLWAFGAGPTALFLAQGALTFGTLGIAVAVMNHGKSGTHYPPQKQKGSRRAAPSGGVHRCVIWG